MGRRNSNAERSALRSASRPTAEGVSVSTATVRPSRPWWPLYARYPVRSCGPANGHNPPSLCQNCKVAGATRKFSRSIASQSEENAKILAPPGHTEALADASSTASAQLRRPRPRSAASAMCRLETSLNRLKCTNGGHSPAARQWLKGPKTVNHPRQVGLGELLSMASTRLRNEVGGPIR
jgi:hypothetical protein